MPVVEIAMRLRRTPDAVDARRSAVGLQARRGRRTWSPQQDALLLASAQVGIPAALVAERLDLPLEAVRRRRRTLGPPRPRGRRYTNREDAALAAALARGVSLGGLAREIGRTEGSLRARARTLGLMRPGGRRRWTHAEDELLREGYHRGLTCEAIGRELLGEARTTGAVSARAGKLGLTSYARMWSSEEEHLLGELCRARASLHTATHRLVRSPEALRRRVRKLGLAPLAESPGSAAGRCWTAQDDAVLRHFPGLDAARLAAMLGRSAGAVRRRQASLGISRDRSPHHSRPPGAEPTPAEIRLIERELDSGNPRRVMALARRLGRHPLDLRRIASARAVPEPVRPASRVA